MTASINRQGLSFNGHTLTVNGRTLTMPHNILDVGRIESAIAVVFDYMEFEKGKRFENLWGIDSNGNRLWIAEAPDSPANAYVNLVSTHPFKAWNFACFVCTLDVSSGRLLDAKFTK